MPEIIIIGAGPAGISAALYTSRAGIRTIAIHNGISALDKAEKIENYYGFSEPVSGTKLKESSIAGAERLGTKFIQEEVVGIGFEDKFFITTVAGRYEADGVIIATGSQRQTVPVKGLKDFEGRGVSYCAVCDAFFYRGKNVAVIGNGDYALHEASELLPVVGSVTILTDGYDASFDIPKGIQIDKRKISEITGDSLVSGVLFSDGSRLNTDGVFIAVGIAGSTALASKIGAITESGRISVNENMETNIKGLYAAGDCTGGLLQISKAVYEGSKAGTELIKYLRKK